MASAAYDSETLRLMFRAANVERAKLQLQLIGDDGAVFDHCRHLGQTTVLSLDAYLGLAQRRMIAGDGVAATMLRLDELAEDARRHRITDRAARYFWPL